MIHRLHFSIEIKAKKTEIWRALWDLSFYKDWVGVFANGSFAITDNWEEGTRVHFLNTDQNGIYSLIDKHDQNKIMSFRHLGKVIDGQEQALDDETKKWSGCTETYKLSEGNNGVILSVEIDVLEEHLDYMNETFPKALDRIKANSERLL